MDGDPRPSLSHLLAVSTRRAAAHAAGSIHAHRGARPLFTVVSQALETGDVGAARRQLDQAWRMQTPLAESVAAIYGRLLVFEGQQEDAALRLLERITYPDAEVAALKAHVLLRLGQTAAARHALSAALAAFRVHEDGLLARIAGVFLEHAQIHEPGWLGRAAPREFVGELSSAAEPALRVRLAGGARLKRAVVFTRREHGIGFRFTRPTAPAHAVLFATVRGRPLLGSGCPAAADFSLDGRAALAGRRLTGWVRVGWDVAHVPALALEPEDGPRVAVALRRTPTPDQRWEFAVDLQPEHARGRRLTLFASLPDGTWQPLPDMPLLLEAAWRRPGPPPPRLARWTESPRVRPPRMRPSRADVMVVIPVYRGRQATLACLAAALDSVGREVAVVVVDDASDDAALCAALDQLAAAGRIELLRNEVNQGFVVSVNRALARHGDRDVVLLNSDAVVFGDWLRRLRDAAYSAPNVGTVTPFSNCGSIASYPGGEQPLSVPEAAAWAALAAQVNDGRRGALPVGVGFCLYVRRDCLRAVGDFDAAVFGKGYGEEADFCLRARALGFTHQLAADVFVHHAGGVSFGARRAALLDRSQRLLNLRHPGFEHFIDDFLARDPLAALRRRLDEARLRGAGGRLVLVVTLALAGGVAQFVAERCRALRARGLAPLLLRPQRSHDLGCCELVCDTVSLPNLRYRIPAELPALTALLESLPIEWIEMQHFLHLDPRVIETVRGLGKPYDVMVHDYAWICPRVTLIDGTGRYCGEPALRTCEACVRRHGSELGENLSVAALRARSARWLAGARRVSAPSHDAAVRLRRYVDLPIEVRPHRAHPQVMRAQAVRTATPSPIRVALIGALGDHKGYQVLLDCARDAARRELPLEFVVVGYTRDDARARRAGRIVITGRYSHEELPYLLERERPDAVLMASVWPETWCYALDEALGTGLPIVAFDLGAIAERLRALGTGTLLPLGSAAARINDALLTVAPRPMSAPRHGAPTPAPAPEALRASVQLVAVKPGLYLFSVRAASSTPPQSGALQLPAVHVGVGPGVPADDVEFIAGPTTDGGWLYAKSHCLVTRVHGDGATLALKSLRGAGGDALAIDVQLLRSRAPAVIGRRAR